MTKTTFEQLGDSRDNNFDFLRFFMAAMVIYAHAFAFTIKAGDPLTLLTKYQLGFGGLAVTSFFVMSGYLVTRSWFYSKGWQDFARKRALRILPGLVVAFLFCVFIVGPMATTDLSHYFINPRTYRFFGLMFAPSIDHYNLLPGVFVNNTWPLVVNGSVWTIRYEICCYVFVALAGLASLYHKRAALLALGVIVYALHMLTSEQFNIVHNHTIGVVFQLLDYFMIGMLMYLYRDRIPYSGILFALCIAALIVSARLHQMVWTLPLCISYALFYVAFSRRLPLQRFARHGDLSYGVYLYAFPIQQLLVTYFPGQMSPTVHFLAALAITMILAALSWHYVENPFLKLKSKRLTLPARVEPELQAKQESA